MLIPVSRLTNSEDSFQGSPKSAAEASSHERALVLYGQNAINRLSI